MDRAGSRLQLSGMTTSRRPYPSDVSDEGWALVAPHLTLLPEDAAQRRHEPRETFDGLRYVVRTGAPWRRTPHDLPPWAAVYQQARRWLVAGRFEMLVHDLRAALRLAAGRAEEPSAAVPDSRTPRSTPESGARAGYDGAEREKGSKLHLAAGTLGHPLAPHVTPATADDRAEVGRLAAAVQEATGESVGVASVDQGHAGGRPAAAAKEHGIALEVVRLAGAERGFVLLPRRRVAGRTFAWTTRSRRLVRDHERLPQTLADLHVVASVCIMLRQAAAYAAVHNSL
jgi:transposase